ncbi:MAG TPA: hypothetical protein VNP73_10490 [Actinomycetota bacterium]|nr:hypothetical protein [Actinomycetota bacterium]
MLLGIVAAPAVLAAAEKSDNVKLVAHFPYKNENLDFFSGGTDIDFSGDYIYAMQQGADGGVHILDGSGAVPKKVGFFACPGEQNDVAVVKPGLIALGYHESMCGGPGAGVRLLDVKNPKDPKLLGAVNALPGGTHTLTVYPGKPIIYASPGGLPVNGGGVEQILDVSNPAEPKVAATFKPNNSGCHDLSFHFQGKEKLAFCAGAGEVQIWDVTDPLAPVTVGRTVPPTQFAHSVAVTHDGKYMVVGDEAVAGNDCVGGPTGALWIYDITNRAAPILQGYYRAPRGQQPAGSPDIDRNTWCSAHLFNFVPGTYNLVTSWYSGGMNVIDLTNPAQPAEIAYYMASGEKKEVSNYWSAYWYDGRIYANDRVRGLDVFTVKGLKEGHHH